MLICKVINGVSEFQFGDNWKDVASPRVDTKTKINGQQFIILRAKQCEEAFSFLERVGRVVLGVFLAIITLFIVVQSEWVKNLIVGTKYKITYHMAVPACELDKIGPASLPEKLCGGGENSTALDGCPEGKNPDALDPETGEYLYPHVIDKTFLYPEKGLFALCDVTSHHITDKHKCDNAKKAFDETSKLLQNLDNPKTIENAKENLIESTKKISDLFANNGTAGSFTICQLLFSEENKQYYLVYLSIGDTDLFLQRTSESGSERLTPFSEEKDLENGRKASYRSAELAGIFSYRIGYIPVAPGDKVFGVSDGIQGFMDQKIIDQVVADPKTTPQNICTQLTEKIKSAAPIGDDLKSEENQNRRCILLPGSKTKWWASKKYQRKGNDFSPLNGYRKDHKSLYNPWRIIEGGAKKGSSSGCDDTSAFMFIVPPNINPSI